MAVPGFKTVPSPVATDLADGATAYNLLASETEKNNGLFNVWAISGLVKMPHTMTYVKDGSFLALASGWAFEGYAHRENWAKKWGGCTYLSIAVKRTGATIAAGTGGNLGDTLIGTITSAYRPLATHFVAAVSAGGLWLCYASTNGSVYLYAASEWNEYRTGQILLFSMLYPNSSETAF